MKRVAAPFVPPIVIERRASMPMQRQIYEWFRSAIAEGRLRPGGRIPSSRGLAAELGISRIPVVNAYEQLHAEGYFEAFVGVGTRVAKSIPSESLNIPKVRQGRVSGESATNAALRQISHRASHWNTPSAQPWLNALGAFRVSLPALDHFPVHIWSHVKSDKVTLSQDTDDWISYSEVAIASDGKVTKLFWTGPQNGQLRPVSGITEERPLRVSPNAGLRQNKINPMFVATAKPVHLRDRML